MATQHMTLSCNTCCDIDSNKNHSNHCKGTISRINVNNKLASPAEIMSIFGDTVINALTSIVHQSVPVSFQTPPKQQKALKAPYAPRKNNDNSYYKQIIPNAPPSPIPSGRSHLFMYD